MPLNHIPATNAFGQAIRPPSAADKRRAAAWRPFLIPMPVQPAAPVASPWTRPLSEQKGVRK